MMNQLEMLTAREQLMEDIDAIVEEFFSDPYESHLHSERGELIRTLCDAVCNNFPTQK